MKAVLARRIQQFDLSKDLNEKKDIITKEEVLLRKVAAKDRKITDAREFYGASKISALVRGYLDRLLCNRIKKRLRAVRLIQRVILGKIGRLRWKREYWRSVSVVKSDTSLREILERSSVLRQAVQQGQHGYHWEELFDPLTDSFWYYNHFTKQNTWHCPLVFQKVLVCSWEGFHEFGGMPHQRPCRAVFGTMEEYRHHMRTAHNWYCAACSAKNVGSSFPRCHLCDNQFNAEGVDGEKAMRTQMEQVQRKLADFLERDVTDREAGLYSIRDRMVELATERKNVTDQMAFWSAAHEDSADAEKAAKQRELNKSYHALAKDNYSARKSKMSSVTDQLSNDLFDLGRDGESTAEQIKLLNRLTATSTSAANKLPPVQLSRLVPPKKKGQGGPDVKPVVAPIDPAFSREEAEESVGHRSVVEAAEAKQLAETGGIDGEIERFRDPVTRGVFSQQDFDSIAEIHSADTSALLDVFSDDEDDDSLQSSVPEQSGVRKVRSDTLRNKLEVCASFLVGTCSLTTCPRAHPGIRDKAVQKLRSTRAENGDRVRTPFVSLCQRFNGTDDSCPHGLRCAKYHVYVRPATIDIVRALYPIATGVRSKVLAGGAVVSGNVVQDQFHGYAVMSWRDGSTYMGDWLNGRRHGFGIFRKGSGSGLEYIGGYQHGQRHGWGLITNANGDEYIGEWKNGAMEGVGVVRSVNGDLYQGEMSRNQYNGTGTFRRANGDTYMGQCRDGMAWGLGVQSLSSGEKYKGFFDRNLRHGKGACAYPNGSRYAGEWYRGCHQGFGIFLSPLGEKYVGQWAGGKKHGTGRYMFSNGDFYDGEFRKDRAQGLGVYYHQNGNIYTGQWENDKRNGKGTYVFENGSKYTGHWTDNDMHVKGRFDFANGSFYRGQFDSNTKHGRGVFTWPNGNTYKGEFQHEKMCGVGEMQYMVGHKYVGHWADNKKNGFGVMQYSTGPCYEGHFVNDIRQGLGKIVFAPGSAVEESYDGQWEADNWHGHGVYRYRADEGTVYEGEWVMGIRHGRGTLRYRDGSYYRGDFSKDQMWGKGVYVGSDGSQYDGEWRANMRQGIGTSIYSDGSIYHGEYWGNMKHGSGKLLRSDGSTYHGRWEGNVVLGTGKVTFSVGDKSKKDGLPKEITMKVFSF